MNNESFVRREIIDNELNVETYNKKNLNGRFRKYTLKEIKENGYKLDLKWLSDDDGNDDRSITELMEDLKEKSKNIQNAVSELEKILKDL